MNNKCDHIIGYYWIDKQLILAWYFDNTYIDAPLLEKFKFCPRCGESLK